MKHTEATRITHEFSFKAFKQAHRNCNEVNLVASAQLRRYTRNHEYIPPLTAAGVGQKQDPGQWLWATQLPQPCLPWASFQVFATNLPPRVLCPVEALTLGGCMFLSSLPFSNPSFNGRRDLKLKVSACQPESLTRNDEIPTEITGMIRGETLTA